MKATRHEVFRAIDNERAYQESRWERPKHNHSATEYLVYIDHYVKKAFARVSTEDGEEGALENLRKIAALAVAAMEECGVVFRGVSAVGNLCGLTFVCWFSRKFFDIHDYKRGWGGDGFPVHFCEYTCWNCGQKFQI